MHCNILQLLQFPYSPCFVVEGVTVLLGEFTVHTENGESHQCFTVILSLLKSKEIFFFNSVNLGPTRILRILLILFQYM